MIKMDKKEIYTCLRCGKKENCSSKFKRHVERKFKCEAKYLDITPQESLKASKDITFKDELVLREVAKLKKTIDNSLNINNSTVTNSSISVDNSVTNNTINVTLSYENTNYEAIKDVISNCITQDGRIDKEKLLSLTHFNKDYPENHNIMIKNRKNNAILAYNGKDYEEVYRGTSGIYQFTKDFLEKVLQNTNEDDEKSQMALDETLNDCENEKDKTKDIQKIGMKLYNNRNMVLKENKKV